MSFPIQLRASDSETLLSAKSDELLQSTTLRIIIEDFEDDLKTGKNVVFPVNVKRETLSKILEWMKKHTGVPTSDLSVWCDEFFGSLTQEQLFDVLKEAYELGIEELKSQSGKRIADKLSKHEPESLRRLFSTTQDD